MLDLRAKLLAAGLVTEEQAAKADDEKKRDADRRPGNRDRGPSSDRGHAGDSPHGGQDRPRRGKPGGPRRGPPDGKKPQRPQESEDDRWARRVKKLAESPKSDQYDAIRGWVDRTRVDDPKSLPSEEAKRFHFDKGDGNISWMTVEPALHEQIEKGEIAIVGFMGFNGLKFAAVPKAVALDVHAIRPEWLRILIGYEFEPLPIAAPRKRSSGKKGEGASGDDVEASSDDAAASGDDAATAIVASSDDAATPVVASSDEAATAIVTSSDDAATAIVASSDDAATPVVASGDDVGPSGDDLASAASAERDA